MAGILNCGNWGGYRSLSSSSSSVTSSSAGAVSSTRGGEGGGFADAVGLLCSSFSASYRFHVSLSFKIARIKVVYQQAHVLDHTPTTTHDKSDASDGHQCTPKC
eukprot:SAG31_NODE_429_length_15801_cov_6.878551_12_plen_104_part_00